MIQLASLVAAGIGPTQARRFEAPLAAACLRFGIDTPLRQAAFVAQCAHESRLFTALEEGLFYRDPARICRIFRSTVPTLAVAQALACNPTRLANHVYANRNGNGDEASGDGWKYRGRGLIQLTGRANYTRAAAGLDRPYVEQPDLVLEPADACLTAGWFWDAHGLNALADASRIDAITRAINGPGMAGAAERRELFAAALAAFQPHAEVARSRAAPPAKVAARAPRKARVPAKAATPPPSRAPVQARAPAKARPPAKTAAPATPRAPATTRSAAKTGKPIATRAGRAPTKAAPVAKSRAPAESAAPAKSRAPAKTRAPAETRAPAKTRATAKPRTSAKPRTGPAEARAARAKKSRAASATARPVASKPPAASRKRKSSRAAPSKPARA